MNILFTGISSFTGLYFVRELRQQQHTIFGVHQSPIDKYSNPHRQRLLEALDHCHSSIEASFGDEHFCAFLQHTPIDVYCHHGAYTKGYQRDDFPVSTAIENNTRNLNNVISQLKRNGCHSIVISSSIFAGNGPVSDGENPFSGYGESKWQTDRLFLDACNQFQIRWARYVIPNPFGPKDNYKLLYEMAKQWSTNNVLLLRTPDYLRDNVHVQPLAEHYANWLNQLPNSPSNVEAFPSGYVEKMTTFAERVAVEIRKRTGWPCQIEHFPNPIYNQPKSLYNTEKIGPLHPENEQHLWDQLAEWFEQIGTGFHD